MPEGHHLTRELMSGTDHLKKNVKFLAVLVLIVVWQAVLSHRFEVFSFFDLPLICSIYDGFTLSNPIACIFIGSSLGLMQDSLSGGYLGVNGFTKTLIAFLAASAGSKFDVEQPVTRIFALVLFTVVEAALVVGIGFVLYPNANEIRQMAPGRLALSAAFNTLSGMIVFGFMERKAHAAA